eukprot:CAMPEP_0114261552 /NCGR_PEP_ID=MMETSP0058-20121206/21211_1 /TAXON_ID=36894 /ORGANISM="Pyramimonas parkeae, CCMP726" /LENGTH=436 /DNA_ID=CAMNT_0001377121 /DNA_START=79 /DNA_END=1386 /DNA_ORIENTATION=-
MVKKRQLAVQSVLDERRLKEFLAAQCVKPVHAKRIWKYVIAKGAEGGIDDVPELPNKVYENLPAIFGDEFLTSTLVSEQTSTDGTTTKLLLELQDGLRVESVIMRYDTSMKRSDESESGSVAGDYGNKRATLCVSSQVGCAMGCTFCATGTMGMIGNLTAGEILEQLVLANRVTKIRNVVFMGMGEPLNNYEEVLGAVQAMIDPQRFGLSPGHITVSTVGVIPNIIRLANDLPTVNFALSLHAPTQELRLPIVPSAKAYPLAKLMDAVDRHHRISGRSVFIEYVMLCGVNDQPEHARLLGQLLSPRKHHVTVNLIPWNPMLATNGAEPFDAPDPNNIKVFHQTMLGEFGIPTTIRMTMGQDIDGACGQLAIQKGVKGPSHNSDIEDLVSDKPGKSTKPIKTKKTSGRPLKRNAANQNSELACSVADVPRNADDRSW